MLPSAKKGKYFLKQIVDCEHSWIDHEKDMSAIIQNMSHLMSFELEIYDK